MSGIATGTAMLIAAGVTAAATIGTTVYEEMNKPSPPKSTDAAASANAAALAQAMALEKRRGMASTILTSPSGAGSATTQKTTLG